MSAITINIITRPRLNIARLMAAPALQVGVIGIGAKLDSPAMQWAGFAMLALMLIAGITDAVRETTNLTIAEARARLDEIEYEEILL